LISQNSGKIVVFTEYNDTFAVICKHLSDNNINYISYNSQTDEKVLDVIAANFDANNPKIQNAYRVLVCTDTLAEGVNLHAANVMVHFDNKWNPSKVTQREGRINRINVYENNHEINIYTFQPPAFVDDTIRLTNRINDKESDAYRLYRAMKNPINISEYINKIDTIIIGNHNTPNAISGKAYILGENEYILFNRDNIPMIVNNNPILYVNQFFQQMDDAILSEKTVFQSYSEYKNEMLNYPKDRRFGDIDWMYGYKDFYGSLKASQNSMRAIKMREFDAMLNTIVRHSNKVKENKYVEYDISELDMKMLRTAFDMQAYGYILYKIFESIHKNRKISEDEKFEVVLLDMIKEFSLFLHNDKNPYLMVGKR
jgi:superfamily II DNA or RNA helicase